jgi:predicted phosphodiesterase
VNGLTIVVPDVHLPYEDKRAVANLLTMIADVQPAQVIQVGDLLDMKAPARWSKGTAAEYCNSVRDEASAGIKFWRLLRQAAPLAKLKFLMGNHEDRLMNYARNFAPALVDIVPSLPQLMELDKVGVEYPKLQPFKIVPGVSAIHGKLLRGTAGMSARKELLRHMPDVGIVQGHTHRAGIIYETTNRTRFALEAGWLGDIKKATYLDYPGVANWQQAFGYLFVDGKCVTPGVVPVHDRGVFSFNGRTYR